jgi:hypothetical protein
MGLEAAKATGPKVVEPAKPAPDLVEAFGAQRVVALTTVPSLIHNTDFEHQTQMLGHRWPADRQSRGQIGDPRIGNSEPFDHLAPQWMGDHAEDIVDYGSATLGHTVCYVRRI